jgi:hypothetical protein
LFAISNQIKHFHSEIYRWHEEWKARTPEPDFKLDLDEDDEDAEELDLTLDNE